MMENTLHQVKHSKIYFSVKNINDDDINCSLLFSNALKCIQLMNLHLCLFFVDNLQLKI